MNRQIHRFRGRLIGLAIAIAVYALVGFFLVPYLVRRQIVQRGSETLHRVITLERVYFNPFTFSGTLDQLVISERGGGGDPLASWERARVNFDPIESLLRLQWRLGQATLIAPKGRLVVDEDGTLNIADLFVREDADEPSQPLSFGVDRLVVERGSLDFIDRSLPTDFSTTVDPINFTLEEFATKADAEGAYRLTGSTGRGETLTWTGNLSAVPFASRGRIEFKGVAVPAYQPFVAAYLNGEIRSGTLDLSTDYDVEFGGGRRAWLRGLSLTLENLNIHLPGTEEPVLEVPSLQLALREAAIFNRTAQVEHITVDRPAGHAIREADGAFNVARLFAAIDATKQPPGAGESDERPAAPQISIDRITVQNGSIVLSDRAVSDQPVELSASQINFVATGASTDLTKPIDVELSLSLQEGPGLLTANGTVTPQPLAAALDLAASQIDLAVASPYLQSMVAVERVSGRAQMQGSLRALREGDEPLKVQFTGQAAVDEMKATGQQFDEAFAEWKHLGIEGAEFSLSPLSLNVKRIQLTSRCCVPFGAKTERSI